MTLAPVCWNPFTETLLAAKLVRLGLTVERQKPVNFDYEGIRVREGFRADLLVDGLLIVEVKSTERLVPVHSRQVLTYLRLLELPLGLLMNFGGETFREGLKRIGNNRSRLAGPLSTVEE